MYTQSLHWGIKPGTFENSTYLGTGWEVHLCWNFVSTPHILLWLCQALEPASFHLSLILFHQSFWETQFIFIWLLISSSSGVGLIISESSSPQCPDAIFLAFWLLPLRQKCQEELLGSATASVFNLGHYLAWPQPWPWEAVKWVFQVTSITELHLQVSLSPLLYPHGLENFKLALCKGDFLKHIERDTKTDLPKPVWGPRYSRWSSTLTTSQTDLSEKSKA